MAASKFKPIVARSARLARTARIAESVAPGNMMPPGSLSFNATAVATAATPNAANVRLQPT